MSALQTDMHAESDQACLTLPCRMHSFARIASMRGPPQPMPAFSMEPAPPPPRSMARAPSNLGRMNGGNVQFSAPSAPNLQYPHNDLHRPTAPYLNVSPYMSNRGPDGGEEYGGNASPYTRQRAVSANPPGSSYVSTANTTHPACWPSPYTVHH